MSDANGTNSIWKVLGGVGVIVSLVASIFSAGMNYARNNDNALAIRDLKLDVEANYMRRDVSEQRFLSLQQQLSRIESAVSRQP